MIERTPLSYVPVSKLKDSIDCEKGLDDKELLFAIYAEPKDFKEFISCYNKQHSYLKKTISFKKVPIKFDSEKKSDQKLELSKERAFIQIFRKIIDDKFEFEKFYRYKKRIQNYNHILARLTESFLFIKLGNMSRAKRILLNITKYDISFHLFNSEKTHFSFESELSYFKEVLNEIGLYFEGQSEFKSLIYYFSVHCSGRFKVMIDSEFEVNYKLSQVREFYESHSFGKPFPFVWGPIVFENSSGTEYIKALGLSEKTKILQNKKQLLLYRSLEAIPRHTKLKIIKSFKRLQNSKDRYDQFLMILLLEDEKFSQFLSANKVKQKKILAAFKRKYYRDILNDGLHKRLSTFKLYSLGDWDRDFIIEMIRHENNRL